MNNTNNHVTVLKIDGKALVHNLNYLKSFLQPETLILAVVKAFGYGSDGIAVANFIKDQVDYFAVAYTQEGIALRDAGIRNRILVLHPQPQNWESLVEYCLEPSIYNFKTLQSFKSHCYGKDLKNYPVHLNFNTGLNRLGFKESDVDSIIKALNKSEEIYVRSVFSHLASSEDLNEKEFTKNQISNFKIITKKIEVIRLNIDFKEPIRTL